MAEIPNSLDAYSPAEMARRVETAGVAKANLKTLPLLALAVLAGAFIALGAMFFTVTMTGNTLGFGPGRVLGGVTFSLGLILVIVGGAELFTGNSLMVLGWADRKVTTGALARNWVLAYIGNFIGAVGMALLAYWAGLMHLGGDAVGVTALKIAAGKVSIPYVEAFFRGILCNILVCLAVWLCFSAHRVSGKILAIVFPITAFVALGFEHSIANMFFIPMAMLAALDPGLTIASGLSPDAIGAIGLAGLLHNLLPVTLGNIVGGGFFVAFTYYVIYLRQSD